MDNVSTDELKESRINLKISPKLRADFQTAARLRGATMSGLLHQFIVKTVREEKEREPQAFMAMPVYKANESESKQNYLFSEGMDKTGKRESRKVKKDIEDIKRDAAERTKRKKKKEE